jgi:hypothetical protein
MKRWSIAFLVLAAAAATPAHANWFDGALQYGENHKKLLGSALTPTPDDLRAVGDSRYGAGRNYDFDEKSGHWREIHTDGDTKDAHEGQGGDAVRLDAAAKNGPGEGR